MLRNGLILAGAAFCALLAGCATSTLPDTRDADMQALKDAETAWVKDAATKDVAKFVAHYTDDASVLIPNVPLLTGKDAISGGLKPLMTDPNFSLSFSPSKVDVAKSGEIGYTQGAYTQTTSDPKTKAPVTEKGKYLTVYRKQADGTWKAVEDAFMADGAPPTEAAK